MQYLASKIPKKQTLDHLNGVQVVGGSNPPIPTICFSFKNDQSSVYSGSQSPRVLTIFLNLLTLYVNPEIKTPENC